MNRGMSYEIDSLLERKKNSEYLCHADSPATKFCKGGFFRSHIVFDNRTDSFVFSFCLVLY